MGKLDEHIVLPDERVRQFVIVSEAERQRLGQKLHDEIGQVLAALSMRLHLLRGDLPRETNLSLDECQSLAAQAIEMVREMSFQLFPAVLADTTLVDTVRYYLDRAAQRSGLSIHFSATSSWTPMPREIENTCLRVVQEAMSNVLRHAAARHVQVNLRQDAESLELSVRDDGVGFAPESQLPWSFDSPTLGLAAMRGQVELLGGRCQIVSTPGQGTAIQVSLPVNPPTLSTSSS